MTTLKAVRTGDEWCLSVVRSPALAEDGVRLDEAISRGRCIIEQSYQRLGIAAGLWQLEFPKAAIGVGEVVVGYADLLAEACAKSADDVCEMPMPANYVSLRTVALALRARGCRVGGQAGRRFLDAARFLLASLVAGLLALFSVMRASVGNDRLPAQADVLFAMHGESSNRTRHLLSVLRQGSPPAGILVLGRPQASLARIRETWKKEAGVAMPPLARPFSLLALLASMPQSIRMLAQGFRLASEQEYLPPARELVAIVYRVLLGAASAAWWRAGRFQARTVCYGHTGIADTTALEMEQQRQGVRTVHVVHGISSGLNFCGRSTVAVFRCGRDARRHERLGGYGQCRAHVAARPGLRSPPTGVLLLTNLAHPMNPRSCAEGILDEACALRLAGEAVAVSTGQGPRLWRPHPTFTSLSEAQRMQLTEIAATAGFRKTDGEEQLADLARSSRWLVSTASTAIVDLLGQGLLPFLLNWQPLDPDAALAHYPLHASDAAGLAALFKADSDMHYRQAMFERAWEEIQPSAPLQLTQITSG
ncbi:hypothetical protein [Arenimonas oryziterrae]|uniref:Uncharacterized protein n=1 Tax=Arenimonas oryziterrae DSM 21050 = YC6267 TaxID=1121015 RepID=A0A091B2H4_9GAMM|nr:hypothetical protein [Arenimonas oryziterrae]KFN45084.1 hypothetical protein N789_03415 [Arenimonas oryziterrae DSM 21050 = YC6267]